VNHTSMLLTAAMLFALHLTVLGHSESARAQGNSADAKRPESPFACNRLPLPDQRKRQFDELGPKLRSLRRTFGNSGTVTNSNFRLTPTRCNSSKNGQSASAPAARSSTLIYRWSAKAGRFGLV
jgi:hypothetical protein